MATYLSPGVYWREQDVSVYTPALSSTSVGMVGLASKGPINEPTFISDGVQFTSIFGEPVTTVDADGVPTTESYGPYAALSYLSEGRQLWYTRVADVDSAGNYLAEKATTTIYENATPEVILGLNSGNITVLAADPTLIFTFDTDVAVATVTIPVTGTSQIYTVAQLASVINSDSVFSAWATAAVNTDPLTPAKNGVLKITSKLPGSAHTIVITGDAQPTVFGTYTTTAGTGTAFAAPKLYTMNQTTQIDNLLSIPVPASTLGLTYVYRASPVPGQKLVIDTNDNATLSDGRAFPSKILNQNVRIASVNYVVSAISSDLKQITITTPPAAGEYSFLYDYSVTVTLLTSAATGALTFATVADAAYWFNNQVNADKTKSFRDHFVATSVDNADTKQLVVSPIDHAGADTNFSVVTEPGATDYGQEIYGNGTGTPKIQAAQLAGTSPVALLSVEALSAGTWGNDISVGVENSSATNRTFDLVVYYKGNQVERGNFLVRTPSNLGVNSKGETVPNTKYVETATSASSFVKVTDLQKDVNTYFGTVPSQNAKGTSTPLTGGANGAPASFNVAPYFGTTDGHVTTGLQNFRNPEGYDINILCVPGISDAAIINEMIDICTTRADCMALVDPPRDTANNRDLTPQQVVDWHNGTGDYNDHAAFNSSYAALYYPWLQIYDPISAAKIWTPPSGHMAKVYAYSDRTTELWFAPAGLNRGHLTVPIKAGYLPTLGERDLLYGNGNAVNPIATFKTDGINVWGQRTLQRTPTALDRVNVRRTLLYLEKVLATASRALLFEPNDPGTWTTFKRLVTPLLTGIKNRRGLTDFKVVCDATVNTPDVVEQNMMKAYIFVKPVKTVEFIQLNFVITSQGSSFNEQVY
jgi:phage tail sheath protein FI